MRPILRHPASLLLGLAFAVSIAVTGCAVRYYDADHGDYHRWDRDEDRAYHDYWNDRHPREPYRAYGNSGPDQQRDYWNWRHGHPDAGKGGDRKGGDRDDRDRR